jgi:hypothetical protein
MADYSLADIAAANGNKDAFGSDAMMFWIFALMAMEGGGFGGRWNGGGPGYVTQPELTNQLNNQTVQNQLSQIALSSANNNYETAQLVNGQTNALMQQNNTNLINAIQGFNQMALVAQNNNAQVLQAIQQLGAQLETCCCSIKTQMLQDRYEDERAKNVALMNDISNYNQTQYILNTTGRWVGWATSGSQTTPTG